MGITSDKRVTLAQFRVYHAALELPEPRSTKAIAEYIGISVGYAQQAAAKLITLGYFHRGKSGRTYSYDALEPSGYYTVIAKIVSTDKTSTTSSGLKKDLTRANPISPSVVASESAVVDINVVTSTSVDNHLPSVDSIPVVGDASPKRLALSKKTSAPQEKTEQRGLKGRPSRSKAQSVRCPSCDAAPGESCRYDAAERAKSGAARIACHAERHNAATSEKPASRGSRISDDWRPTKDDIAFAATHGFLNGSVDLMVQDFKMYWQSAAGAKAIKINWSLTFRNWVIREVRWRYERSAGKRAQEERERLERSILR